MIVAELRVVPMGVGSSMQDPMQKIVEALKETNVRFEVGPVSTSLEAEDLPDVLDAVQVAHDCLMGSTPRIEMELSIDHRLDKEESLSSLRKPREEQSGLSRL